MNRIFWKGVEIASREGERMFIHLAETEHSWRAMYRLYLTFVQPRPIALVSTISADGVANLAPFS